MINPEVFMAPYSTRDRLRGRTFGALTVFMFATWLYLLSPLAVFVLADDSQRDNQGVPKAKSSPLQNAASVNGEIILSREVERELEIGLRGRQITEDVRSFFLAKTLDQLISRRLIVHWLRETKQGVSDEDVSVSMNQLKLTIDRQGQSVDNFLRQLKLADANELRRYVEWQLSWKKFLDRHVNDANRKKYFEQHRTDFDGTEVKVSHILFQVDSNTATEAVWTEARKRADEVYASLRVGTLMFSDAVTQYSQGPSRDQGGEIGWIRRREPMPEAFSRVAFQLAVGQISQPVVTPFGLHLIRCDEIRPGTTTWQEAGDQLDQAVKIFLFDWAAQQGLKNSTVKYSPGFPHFVAGTQEVTLD